MRSCLKPFVLGFAIVTSSGIIDSEMELASGIGFGLYGEKSNIILASPSSVAPTCTNFYECVGILCGITQAVCVPNPGLTGQCIGLICGLTYAN